MIARRALARVLITGVLLVTFTVPATSSGSSQTAASGSKTVDRKTEYVEAVTRGEGFLPWQQPGETPAERDFRRRIEERKTRLLATRTAVDHPVLLTPDHFEQARRNIASTDWGNQWLQSHKELADYLIAQEEGYIARMIPELSPTNPYGLTCPNCVGRKSQEGVGQSLMHWDWRDPDRLTCQRCGQVYPSEQYPETGRLVCPRSGQTFTFYLNNEERRHPDDRSGKHAWHWVGRPVHVSFSGNIRGRKIGHMIEAARSCALLYRFTNDSRYAEVTIRILNRLAHCYRQWLYHDYWDTIADCDPMYAAWHDKNLPLEFKRHLCADAYAKDTADRAAMLQNYWGAGRIHPSTDGIRHLADLALAYDLVVDACDAQGQPLWRPEDRARVERDLLLEYAFGAEPYVGGADTATTANNKVPRIYQAMAAVARCLGLPRMAATALRGYEAVRDECFEYDGFSRESPAYNSMFLGSLVGVPEALHGLTWPADFADRSGTVDLYRTDPMLRLMLQAMYESIRPDGRYAPLSDTMAPATPSRLLAEVGLNRFPDYFEGRFPTLCRGQSPTEYAVFHLDPERMAVDRDLELPGQLFPAWMTAFLRHGKGPEVTMLTMSFCPPGNHRHMDNLSLYYSDRGRPVLGDHGYVGDMPVNAWIRHTFSHNLVIVDDAPQEFRKRQPRFHRMVGSPKVSLVEASSDAYPMCADYRRQVIMIKGPGAETFAVDIFRVKGGDKHDYRLFSELASSNAKDGSLDFTGLPMPPEPALPDVGASLKREDIFGLRDIRGANDPPITWQAVWKEKDDRFRVWMLTATDRVEAANGPGQQSRNQIGRRVRYLGAVREGHDLTSTFVAVLEPSGPDGSLPVRTAKRLDVPTEAGPDAVAVRIESEWGTYLILSEFNAPAQVDGTRFEGALGILCTTPNGQRWLLASGARTLKAGTFGFENIAPTWAGKVVQQDEQHFMTDSPRPVDWPTADPDVQSYVAVQTKDFQTGLPVRAMTENGITVDRFPLPEVSAFHLEAVRLMTDN